MDLWAYSAQLQDFFTVGAGKDHFGEYQPIAVDACELIIHELTETAKKLVITGDVSRAVGKLTSWTEAHPLGDRLYVRRSITDFMDSVFAETADWSMSMVATSMAESIDDLNGRFSIIAEHAPRQARWQAEMLLETGLITREDFARLLHGVESATRILDSAVQASPEIVNAAMDTLFEKMDALVQSIDTKRIATLDALTAERIAITGFIDQQRLAIKADMDEIVARSLDGVRAEAEGIVNNAIWKLAVGLAVLLLLTFLLGMVAGRRARHPQNP
jgi:hypothetical protein